MCKILKYNFNCVVLFYINSSYFKLNILNWNFIITNIFKKKNRQITLVNHKCLS